jgi:hypothetical protein
MPINPRIENQFSDEFRFRQVESTLLATLDVAATGTAKDLQIWLNTLKEAARVVQFPVDKLRDRWRTNKTPTKKMNAEWNDFAATTIGQAVLAADRVLVTFRGSDDIKWSPSMLRGYLRRPSTQFNIMEAVRTMRLEHTLQPLPVAAQTQTDGEWSHPMTLKELATKLGNLTIDKARPTLKRYGLRKAGGRQSWEVRLDTMPRNVRAKFET